MFKKITLLFIFCQSFLVFAQDIPECGTLMPPGFSEALSKVITDKQLFGPRAFIKMIPIKAHVVRNSDGTGGLTEAQLLDAVSIMNDIYIKSNIQFYLCNGINYIDNSMYFDFNRAQENQIAQNDVYKMINIYFVNSITSNGSGLCGYAYYPGGPDRIFMANPCTVNGSTLSHEMGHFFFLPHTHGPSNTTMTLELVDGSNCEFEGDQICDTPADPMLSNSNVNASCLYVGNAVDGDGQKFQPDPRNLMSYARKECRFRFSPEQYGIIEYTAYDVRNYFECNGPAVNVQPFTLNGFCPEQDMEVHYLVNMPFGPNNIFTFELSTSNGSFNSPQILGTVQDNVSGSAIFPLPQGVAGTGYKVRVLSSDPPSVGLSNGGKIIIGNPPTVNLADFSAQFCPSDEPKLLSGGTPAGGIYSGPGVVSNWFYPSAAGPGEHTITYTFANACTTQTAFKPITVEACLGIASEIAGLKIEANPNPARDKVLIKGSFGNSTTATIELYNFSGQRVLTELLEAADGSFAKEIPLYNQPRGLYFLKVSNNSELKIVKLVVQ
jgi:hypothetical protein